MSEWQDDDEVTTTYGSIQLSLSQAHAAGIRTERERITELVQSLGFVWMGAKQNLEISRDDLIDLINKTNEQEETNE